MKHLNAVCTWRDANLIGGGGGANGKAEYDWMANLHGMLKTRAHRWSMILMVVLDSEQWPRMPISMAHDADDLTRYSDICQSLNETVYYWCLLYSILQWKNNALNVVYLGLSLTCLWVLLIKPDTRRLNWVNVWFCRLIMLGLAV